MNDLFFFKKWIRFLIVKLYIFSINYFDIAIWVVQFIHNVATLPWFSLEKEQIAYDNYDEFQPVNFIFSQNFISLFWGLVND
jgi:hypothetical protein